MITCCARVLQVCYRRVTGKGDNNQSTGYRSVTGEQQVRCRMDIDRSAGYRSVTGVLLDANKTHNWEPTMSARLQFEWESTNWEPIFSSKYVANAKVKMRSNLNGDNTKLLTAKTVNCIHLPTTCAFQQCLNSWKSTAFSFTAKFMHYRDIMCSTWLVQCLQCCLSQSYMWTF